MYTKNNTKNLLTSLSEKKKREKRLNYWMNMSNQTLITTVSKSITRVIYENGMRKNKVLDAGFATSRCQAQTALLPFGPCVYVLAMTRLHHRS